MPDALAMRAPDPLALDVVRELKARLQRRFGDRLVAVYLFGSRARGDHRPDSDADVAVFLKEAVFLMDLAVRDLHSARLLFEDGDTERFVAAVRTLLDAPRS